MASSRPTPPGMPPPMGLGDRVERVPRRLTQRLAVGRRRQTRVPVRPGLWLGIGFAGMILVGTVLLLLPFSTKPGGTTDWLTALFTATSAVCVTGLTVVSTHDHWTFAGQVVILALIQFGALGFVSGAIVILTVAGRRASSREQMLFGQPLGFGEPGGLIGLVWRITLFTIVIETIGFALLYWRVAADPSTSNGVWWALFHSISGFTNAGFNIEPGSRSLARFLGDPGTLAVFGVLGVTGTLGFTVAFDVLRRRNWRKLTLESRLVLTIIPALLLIGFLILMLLTPTFGGQVDPDDIGARSSTALMHTVWRTAGFSAVDLGRLPVDTLIAIILLMFIGGASASVAGGVTVNTFGVLMASTLSYVRGRRAPEAFGRRIASATVMRALAITVLSAGAVVLATVALSIAERGTGAEFSSLLFEAVSAFAVVGYSTGITADLAVLSKLVLVATMFAGRLGALTLAQALVSRESHESFRYPEEAIKVG